MSRPPALIPIVAASRDQADRLREQAEKIVKLSGVRLQGVRGAMLPKWRIGSHVFEVKGGLREIRCDGSVMRVLAADANTADGVIPTTAMVDELHRHPDGELYGVLRDGLRAPPPKGVKPSLSGFLAFCELLTLDTGERVEIHPYEKRIIRAICRGVREVVVIIPKKAGKSTLLALWGLYLLTLGAPVSRQLIVISTAGEDLSSPLGQIRERAHSLGSFKRVGMLNTATDDDFCFFEWCLGDNDDPTDFRRVARVNPAPWVTAGSLAREYKSPSMTPGQWRRYTCGLWVAGDDPWVDAGVWDGLAGEDRVKGGERVAVAVVTGRNPGLAVAAPRGDDRVVLSVQLFDGVPSLQVLEDRITVLASEHKVAEVVYDRAGFQRSAELLEARGVKMVEVPLSPDRLMVASQAFAAMVQAGTLSHDGDKTLRGQVLSAPTRDHTQDRGWWFRLTDESRGVVAAAVAAYRASILAEPLKPFIVVGKVG
jgi:hypothetical protein